MCGAAVIDTGERELVGFRSIAVNGLCKNQKLCALHFLHKTRRKTLRMVAIRNSQTRKTYIHVPT